MARTNQRKNIWMIVLIVLLVLAGGYIVFDVYSSWKYESDLNNFQVGAQYGYEQAITQLVEQLQTCQQVPVLYNNQTINVIAVECLQQAAE